MSNSHINPEPRPFIKWAGGKRALLGEIEVQIRQLLTDRQSVSQSVT